MVMHAFDPSTQEPETGRSVRGQPGPHSELLANQSYIGRPCLERNKQKTHSSLLPTLVLEVQGHDEGVVMAHIERTSKIRAFGITSLPLSPKELIPVSRDILFFIRTQVLSKVPHPNIPTVALKTKAKLCQTCLLLTSVSSLHKARCPFICAEPR